MKPLSHLLDRTSRCLVLLCMAPVSGALRETRHAWRLDMANRHGLFALVAIRYFAPLTGAVRALRRVARRTGVRPQ